MTQVKAQLENQNEGKLPKRLQNEVRNIITKKEKS